MRLNDGVHNIGNLLSDKGALTLRHGQRIYEITVSALDYVNGSNLHLLHAAGRVQRPMDEHFVEAVLRRPAARHLLDDATAINITGATSPVYSLEIRLKPAWYATFLAKLLYMLLALAAVTMTLRCYLLRYRQRKAEQLQRLESRRKGRSTNRKCDFFSSITQGVVHAADDDLGALPADHYLP